MKEVVERFRMFCQNHPYQVAFVGFLAIYGLIQPIMLFRPHEVISDFSDGFLNYTFFTNSLYALSAFDFANYWELNILYPMKYSKAFSDHLTFQALVCVPFYWVGVEPLTLFNLTRILQFLFAGLLAFILFYRLSGHGLGSFFGGIVFCANIYLFTKTAHYQMQCVFWFPIIIGGFLMLWQRPSRLGLAVAGAGVLGLALSSPYLLVLFELAILPCALIVAIRHRRNFRFLGEGLTFALVLGGLIFAFYYPYLIVKNHFGLKRTLFEQAHYVMQWSSFERWGDLVWPNAFFGKGGTSSESTAYITWAVRLGLLTTLILSIGSRSYRTWLLRNRYILCFFAVFTFLFLAGSFGPQGLGISSKNKSLWENLVLLPGFSGIRVPARLAAGMFFFLSGFCAISFAGWPATCRRFILPVLTVLLVFESIIETPSGNPVDMERSRPVAEFLRSNYESTPLVHYPMKAAFEWHMPVLYTQIRNPLVGGRSGFIPEALPQLIYPQTDHCEDEGCLVYLRDLGVELVVLDLSNAQSETVSFVRSRLAKVYEDDHFQVFALTGSRPEKDRYLGDLAYVRRHEAPNLAGCRDLEINPWRSSGNQGDGFSQDILLPDELRGPVVLRLYGGGRLKLSEAYYARDPLVHLMNREGNLQQDRVTSYYRIYQIGERLEQWLFLDLPSDVSGIRITPRQPHFVLVPWAVDWAQICPNDA